MVNIDNVKRFSQVNVFVDKEQARERDRQTDRQTDRDTDTERERESSAH